MDGTVRNLHELPEIYGHVFPGYIPRTKMFGSDDVAAGGGELITAPSSPFSEAIRSLRTALSVAVASRRPRTILVTSALGSAGKSTITYNLGVAYAQQGARVLLIDCDLRNPDLHRFFSWPATQGLTEACADIDSPNLPPLVQHSHLPTLSLLPAGEPPELPAEFFASPAFEKLLKKVSGAFDYVLLDSPPILAVSDASVIATKVSAVIAIVRSRNTTKLAVSALAQALQRTDAPVLGFVLNDVDNPSLDGFHEYSYSRGKGDRLAINS
jgi:tyrosine-protein kinase Etk/Wzc